MPSAAAGIPAAISIGSSLIGSHGASDAASQQAAGADAATKLQADIYKDTQKKMKPWQNVGGSAINQLAYLMGLTPFDIDTGQFINSYVTPAESQNTNNSNNNQSPNGQYDAFGNSLKDQYGRPLKNLGGGYGRGVDAFGKPIGTNPDQQLINDQKTAGNMLVPTGSAPSASDNMGYGNVNTGMGGYGSLAKAFGLSDFQADPGYDFRMSEGMKALQRSAAAKGGLMSGAAMKDIARYGQDLASNEYQNAYNRYNTNQTNLYNRLSALAGSGQTANNNMAQIGANYGQNAGQSMQNAANYNASGTAANTNMWTTGLNSLGGALSKGLSGGSSLPWQAAGNVRPDFLGGGFYGF